MHYYYEDNRDLGLVSGISIAFVENVYYQSPTFPAELINVSAILLVTFLNFFKAISFIL